MELRTNIRGLNVEVGGGSGIPTLNQLVGNATPVVPIASSVRASQKAEEATATARKHPTAENHEYASLMHRHAAEHGEEKYQAHHERMEAYHAGQASMGDERTPAAKASYPQNKPLKGGMRR